MTELCTASNATPASNTSPRSSENSNRWSSSKKLLRPMQFNNLMMTMILSRIGSGMIYTPSPPPVALEKNNTLSHINNIIENGKGSLVNDPTNPITNI